MIKPVVNLKTAKSLGKFKFANEDVKNRFKAMNLWKAVLDTINSHFDVDKIDSFYIPSIDTDKDSIFIGILLAGSTPRLTSYFVCRLKRLTGVN